MSVQLNGPTREHPIPPFTRCPSCGGVSMLLRPGKPVICAFCGAER